MDPGCDNELTVVLRNWLKKLTVDSNICFLNADHHRILKTRQCVCIFMCMSVRMQVSRVADFKDEDRYSVSEVGCRRSRRAREEESDTTRAMDLSGTCTSQALINNQQYTIKRQEQLCSSRSMQRFRERAGTLHEEKETLVCRKTSTSSHIEYKKRELLARKAIASCILSRQRNGFELL